MSSTKRFAAALVALVASAAVAVPARADILIVDAQGGPGSQYTEIADAVAMAAEGDVLLVRTGSYVGFTIEDKALTVVADTGAAVEVTGSVYVLNQPVFKTVLLGGLDITGIVTGLPSDPALVLDGNAGAVTLEDCGISAGYVILVQLRFGAAAAVTGCDRVTFIGCTLVSGTEQLVPVIHPGLFVESSTVSIYDSTLEGGVGFPGDTDGNAGQRGGAGLEIASGTALVSNTTARGGDGGEGYPSRLIFGCSSGGDGGEGVLLGAGGPQLLTVDLNAVGGAAGTGGSGPPGCVDGAAGPSTRVVSGSISGYPVSSRRYTVPSVIREGDSLDLVFEGPAGDTLFLFVSLTQDPIQLPFGKGTLLAQQPLYLAFQAAVPAGGTLTIPLTLAELGPGIDGYVLFEQPVFWNPTDQFVLGTGRGVLHLDGATP